MQDPGALLLFGQPLLRRLPKAQLRISLPEQSRKMRDDGGMNMQPYEKLLKQYEEDANIVMMSMVGL